MVHSPNSRTAVCFAQATAGRRGVRSRPPAASRESFSLFLFFLFFKKQRQDREIYEKKRCCYIIYEKGEHNQYLRFWKKLIFGKPKNTPHPSLSHLPGSLRLCLGGNGHFLLAMPDYYYICLRTWKHSVLRFTSYYCRTNYCTKFILRAESI